LSKFKHHKIEQHKPLTEFLFLISVAVFYELRGKSLEHFYSSYDMARFVRFEVFAAVTMKKACLLAPAHAGSSLEDFLLFSSNLKVEAIRSSKTSVNTSTRRHIPENCLLHG
jgi:hypothetical protein